MSSVGWAPQACGAEAGEPDEKIASDPDWQNPNLTGTAAPALTTFTTGTLSTGLKNPVNVQSATLVEVVVVDVDAVVVDVDVVVLVEVEVEVDVVGSNTSGPVSGLWISSFT
jgi:hypothetical protein